MMLKSRHVLIRSIKQVDNNHFSIKWTDGVTKIYQLAEVQAKCPCAGCVKAREEETLQISDDVRAIRLHNVGRYALRIQFAKGCSAGIFNFSQLYLMGKEAPCVF